MGVLWEIELLVTIRTFRTLCPVGLYVVEDTDTVDLLFLPLRLECWSDSFEGLTFPIRWGGISLSQSTPLSL